MYDTYVTRNVSEKRGVIKLQTMDAKAIGEKLVELRGSKTQEEVANAIGVSVSALSMYERGERIPRDNIKIRISSYYKNQYRKFFLHNKLTKRE